MQPRFTRADYDRLPEGYPAELVSGALLKEPAPTAGHQVLVTRLLVRLAAIAGTDRVLAAPADVVVDEFNVFQPDLVVLGAPPDADARDVGIPRVAVEVLSPSTAHRDAGVKRRRLLRAGVAEVWLVDPAAGTVVVWDARGSRAASGAERIASAALPGFEVVPGALFAPPA
jgi:Uma2 family endonuclease